MDLIYYFLVVVLGSIVFGGIGGILAVMLFTSSTPSKVWNFIKDLFRGRV